MPPLIWQEVELRWSWEQWGAAVTTDEALLSYLPFTCCCVTQFLTDHRPVPAHSLEVGDLCFSTKWLEQLQQVENPWLAIILLPPPSLPGLPGGSGAKESACNARDPGFIPGSGKFPGEENGHPLQYSCLENFMDGGDWQATDHGVAKSWTRLSV